MDILEQLALQTKERVKNSMELISADEMKYMALSMQDDTFDFEIALSKKGLSFIAERLCPLSALSQSARTS